MSGINRAIQPAPRPSLIDRHLPNTLQVQSTLRREGRAHVFNDRETLERATQAIIAAGERTGIKDEAGIEDEEDDYTELVQSGLLKVPPPLVIQKIFPMNSASASPSLAD